MTFRLAPLLLAASVFLAPSWAHAFTVPGNDGFMTDATGILTPEQDAEIERVLADYRRQTTNEIAVLIAPSLGGEAIADVAVQVWLPDRQLQEAEHAQQYLYRPRSFEYSQTDRAEVPPFVMPPAARFRALERELDDWFEERRRGRGTRVFAYQRDDAVWFLVRHGEPYKREESLDG
ncbi:MAG TPA: TPM domain-containing protein, partial [Acidimicrobiales bacterium]|nr:TPM domain-containing protein [Acidimicrobiales bacterium]